jgi:hypothetical protein
MKHRPSSSLLAVALLSSAAFAGCTHSYPDCVEGESVFTGTLDDADYDETFTNNGAGLSQFSEPSTLGIDFLDGGSIELEWDSFLMNDRQTSVSGTVQLGPDDEVRTLQGGSSLIIRDEGKQVFLALADGELAACLGF